jgi:hypothetical protein
MKITSPVRERKHLRGEQIMLKKNLWVAGLMVVLAIMFGCVDPVAEEEGGETVTIFDLQEVIKDVPAGVIVGDSDWSAIFKGTPFMMCGGTSNGTYEIVDNNGYKGVKVSKMGPDWGVGFDVYNADTADGTVGVAYRGGDEIHIEGTSDAGSQLILNINPAGEKRLGDVSYDGDFEGTYKLTSADVGTIRGGSPQTVRIHYRSGSANGRKGTIVINELTVKGKRGGIQDTFLDDFEITNTVQEAGWVSAVKITPKKGKSDGKQTIYYASDDGTEQKKSNYPTDPDNLTGDLLWLNGDGDEVTTDEGDANKVMVHIYGRSYPTGTARRTTVVPQAGLAGGKPYVVTFDVAAVPEKFNGMTDLSAGTLLIFSSLPTANKVVNVDNSTWGESGGFHFEGPGAAATIINGPFGDVSGRFAFLFNNAGVDLSEALPENIQSATNTPYPRLCIQFGNTALAGPAYAGYKEAIITYDLIKCEISSADSTNMTIRKNAGTGYSNNSGDQYPDFKEGKGQTIIFPASYFTGGTTDGISIQKNHGDTGVLLRITKIEFVAW